MAAIKLPYFAPTSELPQPLPTDQEIHSATEQHMESGGRRLVRIGPYMIKHGSGVSVIEGENMLFVSRETTIPVPQVYAIYTATEISSYTNSRVESNYIVMEYLEGATLDYEWGLLSAQQKDHISVQLREHMNQLRSIPPPGYYGSIGRRGLLDCIFWTGNDACAPLDGPFDTEHALNEAMRSKFIYNNLSPVKAEFYRRAFPVVLQGHAPVFTHGDFQRKNIIIKRISPAVSINASTGAEHLNLEDDTFDLAIIDWENAGWYPDYWESAIALFACGSWSDDWHVSVGNSLKLFLNEYAWMQMLRNELWS
ncbi:phosphotransferase enzyme family protein [Rhexocercosporidium sp. MPI-PUGE-AT-0058]|nr:phosphotransferase enzyme family protein [Rhexocercosporidium sp. MPI-PUGE-AT-0058]